jgi:molybdenum cofactor synthesis domain-containing protein
MELAARVLTVSDRAAQGTREDRSGPALVELLTAAGWHCDPPVVVTDGVEPVREALLTLTDGFAGLVVTTGGTGFAQRDRTPEATREVIEREAPGLAEATRAPNPLGQLSRGVAGTVGRCVILNVPGSVAGATESLEVVLDMLAHAVALVIGEDPHGPGGPTPPTGPLPCATARPG